MNFWLSCSLLVCLKAYLIVVAISEIQTDYQKRIINGRPAHNRKFYVQVWPNGVLPFCQGVVVEPTVVLTAAGCLTEATEVFITFGDFTTDEEKGRIDADRWYVHEDFDFDMMNLKNDLGVIILEEPLDSHSVLEMCSPSYTPLNLRTCGMGFTNKHTNDPVLPDVLMETAIKEAETCFSGYDYDPDTQICVNGQPGDGTVCHGDEGSPLFDVDEELHPICLYGTLGAGLYIDGRDPQDPICSQQAIFTRTSGYKDWIQDKVERDDEEEEYGP